MDELLHSAKINKSYRFVVENTEATATLTEYLTKSIRQILITYPKSNYTSLLESVFSSASALALGAEDIKKVYSALYTEESDLTAIARSFASILEEYNNATNSSMEEEPLSDSDFIDDKVTECIASAFGLAREVIQPEKTIPVEIPKSIPQKLTLSDAINLIMLLLTILSLYLGSKPDPQLDRLIDLQEQQVEILHETYERQTTALNELGDKIAYLTEVVETLTEDDDCDTSDFGDMQPLPSCSCDCHDKG